MVLVVPREELDGGVEVGGEIMTGIGDIFVFVLTGKPGMLRT